MPANDAHALEFLPVCNPATQGMACLNRLDDKQVSKYFSNRLHYCAAIPMTSFDVADTIIDTNKIIACGTPMFRVRMQRWIAAVRSIPSPLVMNSSRALFRQWCNTVSCYISRNADCGESDFDNTETYRFIGYSAETGRENLRRRTYTNTVFQHRVLRKELPH